MGMGATTISWCSICKAIREAPTVWCMTENKQRTIGHILCWVKKLCCKTIVFSLYLFKSDMFLDLIWTYLSRKYLPTWFVSALYQFIHHFWMYHVTKSNFDSCDKTVERLMSKGSTLKSLKWIKYAFDSFELGRLSSEYLSTGWSRWRLMVRLHCWSNDDVTM